MDFKEEQDAIFAEINKRRLGIRPKGVMPEGDYLNNLGVLTGLSIWLLENEADIETIDDFRRKIDSFNRVLNDSNYIGMERNLCIASGMYRKLNDDMSSSSFEEFADIAGMPAVSSQDFYESNFSKCYGEAKSFFDKLKDDETVRRNAEDCKFKMNFDFSSGEENVLRLYSAVSIFRDISDKLEDIYSYKAKGVTSSKTLDETIKK